MNIFDKRLWNIGLVSVIVFMIYNMNTKGLLSTVPSDVVGGYHINLLLYVGIFFVTFNMLTSRFDEDISIFFAFNVTVLSLGIFETSSFINVLFKRQAEQLPLLNAPIVETIYKNLFRFFRVGWYWSTLIPIWIYNKEIGAGTPRFIYHFIVLTGMFYLYNIYLITQNVFYIDRFFILFTAKLLSGLTIINVVREW